VASDFVAIEVSGLEDLIIKLKALPGEVQDEAIENVNTYMLNVLKIYPPYKYVKFKTAYGGWFSDKQRKYVMARIREGTIKPGTPNRSQQFAQGWDVLGYGRNSMIVNTTPYGPYLVDDAEQARMPQKIGWKKLGDTIKERMDEIMRRASAGVTKAIKKLGL
jgi:hypothetical protein